MGSSTVSRRSTFATHNEVSSRSHHSPPVTARPGIHAMCTLLDVTCATPAAHCVLPERRRSDEAGRGCRRGGDGRSPSGCTFAGRWAATHSDLLSVEQVRHTKNICGTRSMQITMLVESADGFAISPWLSGHLCSAMDTATRRNAAGLRTANLNRAPTLARARPARWHGFPRRIVRANRQTFIGEH